MSKPETKSHAWAMPSKPEAVPVKVLILHNTERDLPDVMSNTITVGKTSPSDYEIHFLPWLRSFQMTITSRNGDVSTRMVPEHCVAEWQPA